MKFSILTNKLSILIVLGMCIIALTGCSNSESDNAVSIETCEDLAPEIIELSEERAGEFSPSILKLYDIREVRGTNVLDCRATGKMSDAYDSIISFHLEEDADGDQFIGYQAR